MGITCYFHGGDLDGEFITLRKEDVRPNLYFPVSTQLALCTDEVNPDYVIAILKAHYRYIGSRVYVFVEYN